MKKTTKLLMAGVLSVFCASAMAVTVPNKFTANTPAVASEVNENFSALEEAINSGGGAVELKQRKIIDKAGFGKASCLAGETVVSSSCFCSGNQEKGTNYGVVFACRVDGNSATGGCFPYLYNDKLAASPIEITAVCVSSAAGKQKAGDRLGALADEEPVDLEADRAVKELREQVGAMQKSISSNE